MTAQKWFRAKRYGWGWVPVSWQGWLIIFAHIGMIAAGAYLLFDGLETNNTQLALFFIWTFVWTLPVMYAGYRKGEQPRWRWGGKDEADR